MPGGEAGGEVSEVGDRSPHSVWAGHGLQEAGEGGLLSWQIRRGQGRMEASSHLSSPGPPPPFPLSNFLR